MRNRNSIRECSRDQFCGLGGIRFYSPFLAQISGTLTPIDSGGKRWPTSPVHIGAGGANRCADFTTSFLLSIDVSFFSSKLQILRDAPPIRGPPTPSRGRWRLRRTAGDRFSPPIFRRPLCQPATRFRKNHRDFAKTQPPQSERGGIATRTLNEGTRGPGTEGRTESFSVGIFRFGLSQRCDPSAISKTIRNGQGGCSNRRPDDSTDPPERLRSEPRSHPLAAGGDFNAIQTNPAEPAPVKERCFGVHVGANEGDCRFVSARETFKSLRGDRRPERISAYAQGMNKKNYGFFFMRTWH